MRQSIILTGPMGSGKTSVGKLLAKKLGFHFNDLDEMICSQTKKTISQLFCDYGEDAFRDIESNILATTVKDDGMVLSTGGGVVLREQNRLLLQKSGLIVNLKASLEELSRRLALAEDRPLLKGNEPLETLISRMITDRELFYADADIRIDTTMKTLEDVSTEILQFYSKRQQGKL